MALELPAGAAIPGQDQLTRLLSGNTLDGVWAGRPYRQYFAASGSTRYQEGNSPPTTRTWRVDSDGQYCSIWAPSSQEACYLVLVYGNEVFWKSGGKYFPSRLTAGNTFD
jgi:hypothetical protein